MSQAKRAAHRAGNRDASATRGAWSAIRTGAIAGWSAGAVLGFVTHTPMQPSIGVGVIAGIVAGATYPLLARLLAIHPSR